MEVYVVDRSDVLAEALRQALELEARAGCGL
jgi:hypothetical protein